MRIIKAFESFSKKSIKETCEDILLELQDDGFSCIVDEECVDLDNKDIPDAIAITLNKSSEPSHPHFPILFNTSEVLQCVTRIIGYLGTEGYKLESPVRVSKGITLPVTFNKVKNGIEVKGICFVFKR